MKYPHPPQLMTAAEVKEWADLIARYRADGRDLDKSVPVEVWKLEGMLATIQSLQSSGTLASRPNSPSADVQGNL